MLSAPHAPRSAVLAIPGPVARVLDGCPEVHVSVQVPPMRIAGGAPHRPRVRVTACWHNGRVGRGVGLAQCDDALREATLTALRSLSADLMARARTDASHLAAKRAAPREVNERMARAQRDASAVDALRRDVAAAWPHVGTLVPTCGACALSLMTGPRCVAHTEALS